MVIAQGELEKQLSDAGIKLLSPSSEVSELLVSVHLVESLLSNVEQSPSESMKEALVPSTKALISEELLRHSDDDVKIAVASCISEITRITAPEAPYQDDEMKEVFELIVSTFGKLDDKSSRSYSKRISILETLARVRSCVVMLDLECDDLILEMFKHFFRTIRDDHQEGVFTSMETIMTLVLEESEDISVDLLSSILDILKKDNKEVLPIACKLAENVIANSAGKIKPYLLRTLRTIGSSLGDYRKVVADVSQAVNKEVEPTDVDDAEKNSGDENDLVNVPSERADEVAMETMEDAPPSEEVGPSAVGSPKTVIQEGNADNSTTIKADRDIRLERVEPSKGIAESVADKEPPKSKPQKSNRRKGRKPTSTNSSLEPFEPVLTDRKMEVLDTREIEEDDVKDANDIESENPAGESAVAAHNEKSSDVSIPSPRTGRGKKKEHPIQENESISDVDSKKESDTKLDSEGASEKPSLVSGREESVPDSTDNAKKEDDNISELDGSSAKEAEVGGSQRVNNKKRGQAKATPAKGQTKTPAKDEKKKTVAPTKSAAKAVKDESMEEVSRSSSKRKRPSEDKAQKTKVFGPELVGTKVEVWWPDDKQFYKGVVKSYDAAEKEHKVFYDDGDVELLNLKNEVWKMVDESEGHASDGGIPDDKPKGKKAKASGDIGAKQGKSMSSTKMSGASSSKSKTTPMSGSTRKDDSTIVKKGGKSDVDKIGKSKASKSGKNSKDDDEDTPKVSSKSKQDSSKGSVKSKGKSPKTVGKSNSSSSNKVKYDASSTDDETEDELPESERTLDKAKGKSQNKSQKNSKKRKQGA